MDTYRAFLAIIISFVILLGYQYFFVGFDHPANESTQQQTEQKSQPTPAPKPVTVPVVQAPAETAPPPATHYDRKPKDITVETDLYTAVLSEDGGTITSFVLKKQKETNEKNSPGMQLVNTTAVQGFPLQFSWGSAVGPQDAV